MNNKPQQPIINMNLQLQNELFKQFQKKVFYERHFQHLKVREDGRQFQQIRKSAVILNSLSNVDGNCIMKKGQMLITCMVQARFEEQFINVLRNEPHTPLIVIQVSIPETRLLTGFEKKKKQSYISHSIQEHFHLLSLQEQLLTKHKFRTFGHRLQITIRVLSEDGNILPHCLLAAQLALLTTKLKVPQVQGEELKETNEIKVLDLNRFVFPVVMASINNQIIVDPSKEEERAQEYSVTNWIDVVGDRHEITKDGDEELEVEVLMKIQQQVQEERARIRGQFNIKSIVSQLIESPKQPLNLDLSI